MLQWRNIVRAAIAVTLGGPLFAAPTAQAGEAAPPVIDAFQAAFFDDATFTLHARSYLFDEEEDPGSSDPAAWAAGGWLGYQTGWIGDVLQFGAVGYTSQPLWAPASRPGSQLLLPDQKGFSVLGQAYAALRLEGQTLTLYRQIVDQPEVNEHDSRMVPNTFEGGTLKGDLGPVSYFGAVLNAMKTRDSDVFVNVAKVAGVPQDELMYLATLEAMPLEGLKLRSSAYAVPNVLASSYSDARWRVPLSGDLSLDLAGQFMVQGGIGSELLTGPGFRPWVAGVEGTVGYRGLTFSGGYTANGTDDEWNAPYGVWPGYSHMLIKNFYRAGEQAVLLGAGLDGSLLGLDGFTLLARAAIDVTIGEGQDSWQEYDVTASYSLAGVPPEWSWVAPVALLARYGRLESEAADGSGGHTDQLRLEINYQLQFTGGQFRS